MKFYIFSLSLLLAGSATAASLTTGNRKTSLHPDNTLAGRQFNFCVPVAVPSCAKSCGAGNIVCQEWPSCYNPGDGETCCSDGKYCRNGYYCTSDGCCPNGETCSGSIDVPDIDINIPDYNTDEISTFYDSSTSHVYDYSTATSYFTSTSYLTTSSPFSSTPTPTPTPTETETETGTETETEAEPDTDNPFRPTQTRPPPLIGTGGDDDDDNDSDSDDSENSGDEPAIVHTGAAVRVEGGSIALTLGGLGLGALFMAL